MLTAKDALQWVTRRPSPPWRLGELRSAFKADPAQTFSLVQAITGLEEQKCVISVSIRDAALLRSAATFGAFQSAFNASVPSRETLGSVISLLGAHGASLTYLSNDWKTAAITASLGNLSGIGGIVITESDWPEPGKALDAVLTFIALVAEEPIPMFIGMGELTENLDTGPVDLVNSAGFTIPQSSSAGGDTAITAGSDTIYIPSITITGSFTGVNPDSLVDAPPLDLGEIPDTPPDSGGDGGDGGGSGGG